MADHAPDLLLEVRAATKRFPGVRALDHVDLTLAAGEVLAVVGENGAGKSTLMRILAGVEQLDSGQVLLHGRPLRLGSAHDVMRAGIALIHQELNLCDNLSVEANIFLGREPRRAGWIRRRPMRRQTRDVLRRIALDVDPAMRVDRLSIGQQQMVEIARALSIDARILIMDEPTSSLSLRESETLFRLIGQLRSRGVGIIYISHRLSEVTRVADRVLVLRDGRNAGQLEGAAMTHDGMVRLMVGRDVRRTVRGRRVAAGKPQLEVRSVSTAAYPRQTISLTVPGGEIVGIAGLVGAGRSELLRAIFGIDWPVRGRIIVGNQPLVPGSPRDAIQHGVALVPEDRKQHGLLLEMPVRDNLSVAALRRDALRRCWIDQRAERALVADAIRRLGIRARNDRQSVQFLSGGNQQKVVLGKWLALAPNVLLLDEPTRGVDVGAKQEIYRLIEQLAERGVAILFASSEMEEIIQLANRVLVMHEGRIAGNLVGPEIAEQSIMRLATGQSESEKDS